MSGACNTHGTDDKGIQNFCRRPWRERTKTLYAFFISPVRATCPVHFTYLDLITQMKVLFISILPYSSHFITLSFYCEKLLGPIRFPDCRTTPCLLSVDCLFMYLQLPSISGGRLLHPQPENAPCSGDVTGKMIELEIALLNNHCM
jgi:hypothetical protein